MKKQYYFAYGSNLHPVRLRERVPSAILIGTVELKGYQIQFHKRGADQSGKCNLIYTNRSKDIVHGAIFQIRAKHRPRLDIAEGKGYRVLHISVKRHGKKYKCFTYVAHRTHINKKLKPYDWYQQLVKLGAQHLSLSQDYVDQLAMSDTIEDLNSDRQSKREELLNELKKSNNNQLLSYPAYIFKQGFRSKR